MAHNCHVAENLEIAENRVSWSQSEIPWASCSNDKRYLALGAILLHYWELHVSGNKSFISMLKNTGWTVQGLLHWLYVIISHCITLFSPFTVWFETVNMDFSRLHTYTPPQCLPENTGYTYALRWEPFSSCRQTVCSLCC